MNEENCALKLVDEIILYYDARSKKLKKKSVCTVSYDSYNQPLLFPETTLN